MLLMHVELCMNVRLFLNAPFYTCNLNMAVTCSSWEDARSKLQTWREENARCSEEVLDLWHAFLESNVNKLGEEKWLVLEQVCLAAIDTHRYNVVEECLRTLDRQFPGSLRVRKLKAMRLEMLERYDDALRVYDGIIQRDEANAVIYKRKIAVLKAQNRISDCTKELTEYLKKFMSDQEAWLELCDLYISEQEYHKAAFCMEELILSNPHNHLFHQRYAEIQYTIGGMENLELSRAYFTQAVKLNPKNARSLYGLYVSSTNLASLPKCSVQKKKECFRCANWAMQKLSTLYSAQKAGNLQMKSLENMLNSLNITTNG